MSYSTFKSTNDYARLNTLKNRNKNFLNKDNKYKFIDTTGSYLGFKETKSGPVYMCSCTKECIKRDIKLKNIHSSGYKGNLHYDIVWYIGPLLPRDIFKALDFNMLMNFKRNANINVEELISNINFKDKICRICKVENNNYENISFEEFTDLKLFYKHQILNENSVYSDFHFPGGLRKMSYDINEYIQKKVGDKYEVEINEIDSYLEDIKKIVPIEMKYYNEKMNLDFRYFINNKEFYEDKKYFEDVDLIMKERLGYAKAIGRWKREEELYSLIKKIYSKYNIIYQYRPQFLLDSVTNGQQSLDIYIEELKTGIEYQGKQHYEPVEIFGGQLGFEKTVKRDKKKYELCKKNGIKIVYIKYNEKLTVSNIKKIIDENILDNYKK